MNRQTIQHCILIGLGFVILAAVEGANASDYGMDLNKVDLGEDFGDDNLKVKNISIDLSDGVISPSRILSIIRTGKRFSHPTLCRRGNRRICRKICFRRLQSRRCHNICYYRRVNTCL